MAPNDFLVLASLAAAQVGADVVEDDGALRDEDDVSTAGQAGTCAGRGKVSRYRNTRLFWYAWPELSAMCRAALPSSRIWDR